MSISIETNRLEELEGIIDLILRGECRFGFNQECEYIRYQEVARALNGLLVQIRSPLSILNVAVEAFVRGQGRTDITILEAAIIMRWPALVARLLALGADPNLSTSGVSLVQQLLEAEVLDPMYGSLSGRPTVHGEINEGRDREIINLLLQAGAIRPPGFFERSRRNRENDFIEEFPIIRDDCYEDHRHHCNDGDRHYSQF